MKSKDWHVKDFDIYSGTFDDFKRLVYYDLETFADEEEGKLKEKERLESEQKDKEHIIELKKLIIAEKELDIDSDQQFLRGLLPLFLILASFLVMAVLFMLFKYFKQIEIEIVLNDEERVEDLIKKVPILRVCNDSFLHVN